jgi:hypothetical protein
MVIPTRRRDVVVPAGDQVDDVSSGIQRSAHRLRAYTARKYPHKS